ncbi:MAG: serine/threonine-protein kinase [Oscillospiraceae bacterium]|nr:serine/threonine-protein kinase [Oscillospiraceae bacterium]
MGTRTFRPGDRIPMELGGEAEITQVLGQGGQGTVYRASYRGRDHALKMYFPNKLRDPAMFRENLQRLCEEGSRSPVFLMPKMLTEQTGDGFGYLMELIPPGYVPFTDILNARVKFSGLYSVVNAAVRITAAFRELHNSGRSYQDLNDGGFFIRPTDGDVLICDCDNIAPYGEHLGIAGKPGYMAPEIVRGEKAPDKLTDRWSLAVVLFRLLLRGDPLEGRKVLNSVCLTEDAERRHYGFEPIFVYDPDNDSNRPVRGVHNNIIKFWRIMPDYIRDAFTQSFTVGSAQPEKRLIEKQWLDLLIRMRNDICACSCGAQGFISGSEHDSEGRVICPCGEHYQPPLALHLGRQRILLFDGARLFDDSVSVIGEVVRNKINPSLWGLKNLSSDNWQCTLPNGQEKQVVPGSAAPIFTGTKIVIGEVNGEINGDI